MEKNYNLGLVTDGRPCSLDEEELEAFTISPKFPENANLNSKKEYQLMQIFYKSCVLANLTARGSSIQCH